MSHPGSLRGFVPDTTVSEASEQHVTAGKASFTGEMASVPLKLCPTESIRITGQVCAACCQIKSQAHGAEVTSLTQAAEGLHVHLYAAHIHTG